MRSPASEFEEHAGMLDLAAKVGELKFELNNQMTLVRNELKDIHTRLPAHEQHDSNEEGVGHVTANLSWSSKMRGTLAEQGNQQKEPETEVDLEQDRVGKRVQGNSNTETSVAPRTISRSSNGWFADLDAAMAAKPSHEVGAVPGGLLRQQIVATQDDLHKLREEVQSCLFQAVTTAKEAATESVEAQLHKLLHGMEPYCTSAQKENTGIDDSQRASTSMLHAAVDRLAISHGQLLEAVAPSTTMLQAAVDRLATSHGQLLEAVAEQAERLKCLELQLNSLSDDSHSVADGCVFNSRR